MTGYRIYDPKLDIVDVNLDRPEGHEVTKISECEREVVCGIIIPVNKFTYAVDCKCGHSHPVINNKILWKEIFKKEWDRNLL